MTTGTGGCCVCGEALRDLGKREDWTYAACEGCGSVQLVPMPSEEELERLYRDEYHAVGHYGSEPEEHRLHRWRVCEQVATLIASLHGAGDERLVVDLGSGWGMMGTALREREVPYLGLEISTAMSEYAKDQGLDVRVGGLEVLETSEDLRGRVRTFAMVAVYEHLVDQLGMLRRMARLLPDDGAIVIQCPTAGIPRTVGRLMHRAVPSRQLPSCFGSLAPPWHVCLPTPAGVRHQAKAAGLRVESVRPSNSGRRADWRRHLQALNETVAFTGFSLFGEGFPLSMAHIFVLRKN